MSNFAFEKAQKEQEKAHIALAGPSGSGKAQPLDAHVLTPRGWAQIGDINVGDSVFAADGSITEVVGVYPQGVQPIYKLTLSDGSEVESTDDHLWVTQTVLDRSATTKVRGKRVAAPRSGSPRTLAEIRATLVDGNGKRNHWLPMVEPMDFAESDSDLPLNPWLLGALLGDGCFRGGGVTFSKPGQEVREMIAAALPDDAKLGFDTGLTVGISGTRHGFNSVLDALRSLGLHGLKSLDKHVPASYKYASVKTRTGVLAGLLDTDGYASGATCEFATSSHQLADDVKFLVQSLGGTVTTSSRRGAYVDNSGEVHAGAEAFRLQICPTRGANPFTLPAKASRFTPRSKYPARRSIAAVDLVRQHEAVCIAIAHPSRLYITDNFVPTHNTYTALTLAKAFGGTTAVIDTERRSARKYASVFEFDTIDNLAQFSPEALPEILAAAAGYTTVIVDSLSHFWMGVGGMLEQVDRLAKRNSGGNSFGGWKDARPMERRMIDALLAFPGHVIVTMRTKTEWIVEEDSRGKKVPRKLGLKPEQRDGIEYEFDVVGDLDLENNLTVSKTRCSALQGYVVGKPGRDFAQIIMDWLDDGVQRVTVPEFVDRAVALETYADALALHAEVQAAGKLGASVTDDEGTILLLGELIGIRGSRLRDAEKSHARHELDVEPATDAA